jgi:hypothetical protein
VRVADPKARHLVVRAFFFALRNAMRRTKPVH